ncbi:DUF6807 family protein [Agriterribacter sp.]|uniref:DUF6807 family protein n=1 Tax=Agriterribacter sp. TaxID=2821509 RepID=UPI002C7A1F2D|nr:DUF6807 family protein [Agriterribacter sp.]HRO47949.1 PmoA family protein [Agriterribacter sp.]HRQ18630.1 PmoA family protein [Agriterribacter sp.]
MKKILSMPVFSLYLLLLAIVSCSVGKKVLIIEQDINPFIQTGSPMSVETALDNDLLKAAEQGRLAIFDLSGNNENKKLIPAQLEKPEAGANVKVVAMAPGGPSEHQKFKLTASEAPFKTIMKVSQDPGTGQVLFEEDDKRVLQYNYQTVYDSTVVRLPGEPVEVHTRTGKDTFQTASIYAVPRSDYIHPLYGLEGEMLTRDWPDGGHPHHRGIFWAWPEVEIGTSRKGDIYALQKIFARPTGKIELTSGTVFAQVAAENVWMWEDRDSIVREEAVIRVYPAKANIRIIDLSIKLDALADSITIATRETNSYGGLNLRMMTPQNQLISYFADQPGSAPLRAWSDFNGTFEGNPSPSGLMVVQHNGNPEYPGAWVEYPNLAWVQPTFPTSGTRFPLLRGKPLVLHYRLVVHAGGKPDENLSKMIWDAYNHTLTPLYLFSNPVE